MSFAWSEISVGNLPADRRFIMSSGPFTMKPSNEQVITIAAVWARDLSRNTTSLTKLGVADDKIQDLFDSCFDTTKIPYAAMNIGINKLTVNPSCPINGQVYTRYFGDGSTSNLQNPTHTYTTPGYYCSIYFG